MLLMLANLSLRQSAVNMKNRNDAATRRRGCEKTFFGNKLRFSLLYWKFFCNFAEWKLSTNH